MRRLWAAAATVLVAALGLADGSALAHAQLESISPANGEVVAAPPAEVVLTFNEPVSLTGGAARVLDDAAADVSGAAVQEGVTITIPLESGLPDGTYTVTWEVVSGDSHRIAGASVFHVGAATSQGLDVSTLDGGSNVPWGVRLGAATLSGVAYAATFAAIGVWAFRVLIERTARADGSLRLDPLATRAAVLGAVTLVAAVPFRIARVGGGLDALSDNDVLTSELKGPIGQAVAVTVLGLIAFAIAVDRLAPRWVTAALGLVALGGFALEGHTRAIHLRWAMISSDVVHLAAGAVWLGGIVAILIAFRQRVEPIRIATLVRRFSDAALVAVAVVTVTGTLMAWIVLPTVGELTSTGYGLALLVKVALVAVVLALGGFNRFLLVPLVSSAPDTVDAPRRRLSQVVVGELLLLLAVVGTTAVLVTRSPVTTSAAAPAAGPTDPTGPTTTVPPQLLTIEMSDGGTVEVSLAPARSGPNILELVLRDREGRVINPLEDPSVEFTEETLDIGPIDAEVTPTYIGEYTAEANLVAGTWTLNVRTRVSDFESVSGSTTVAIS
jgi:copper transport protein